MGAHRDDAAILLARTWFGSRLPPAALERVGPHVRLEAYRAGTEILREGDVTTDIGIVHTGRVALRMRVPGRGPMMILTVEPGDIVGWSAIVPPHRATSTVVAVEPSELLSIEGERLRTELANDPALAAPIYLSILEALTRRLSATRFQLLDLFAAPAGEPW
jgi:CRP-like cAMP-binding protein